MQEIRARTKFEGRRMSRCFLRHRPLKSAWDLRHNRISAIIVFVVAQPPRNAITRKG